ncbi:membrane protein insertase YidC, partial [Pseudomonas syringae pv. tagetis]
MDIKRTIQIVALSNETYDGVVIWIQANGDAPMPTHNVAASTTAPANPDTAAATKGSASADVPTATANTAAAPHETPAVAS